MAVTAAERALVQVATMLVDGRDPVLATLEARADKPSTGLSAEAQVAVRDLLRVGVARQLVLGAELPPWRHVPPLAFGEAALDIVHWLYAQPCARRPKPLVLQSPPTAAEGLLLARLAEIVDVAGGAPPEPCRRSSWAWLLAGRHLARHGPVDLAETDVEVVLDRDRGLLRVLQPRLHDAWRGWARAVRAAAEVAPSIALGEPLRAWADRLLPHFAEAPEHVGFLADLAGPLAALPAAVWPVARGEEPLSRWVRARRARVAIPGALVEHLGRWGDQWRRTGFVDDDYDLAKRCLARFEAPLRNLPALRDVVASAERLPEVG